MPVDKVLNCMVAEHLFCFEWAQIDGHGTRVLVPPEFEMTQAFPGVPDYTSNVARIWSVVRRMAERGRVFEFDENPAMASARFYRQEDREKPPPWVNNGDMPVGQRAGRAICAAALKAIEIEVFRS